MVEKKTFWEKIKFNDFISDESESLVNAVCAHKDDKIDRLLEIGADPYKECYFASGSRATTSISAAASDGNTSLIEKFLAADCVKNEEAIQNARRAAVKTHKIDSITCLFNNGHTKGLDVDRMLAATETHDKPLLKALFENDTITAVTQEELDQCFVEAARAGITENMAYLHSLGADINARNGDDNAFSAIANHQNVREKHYESAAFLADNGFAFDAKDKDGNTMAELAAAQGLEKLTLIADPEFPKEEIKKRSEVLSSTYTAEVATFVC